MKLKLEHFLSGSLSSRLMADGKPSLWIFGYGSLIWNPGFAFEAQRRTRLSGYSRRFYQGNTTYRGTETLPGRVVTLLEDRTGETYGLAYRVTGLSAIVDAIEHLHKREVESGYNFRLVQVICLETNESFQALTCVATKQNSWYLGPLRADDGQQQTDDQEELIAGQIAKAVGKAGPNHQYLIQLAEHSRRLFPGVVDEHLFRLESFVLAIVNSEKAVVSRKL